MSNRGTNEWEFQGQVLTWLNQQIERRPGLGLDIATQEPSKLSPKRNDLVVWWNRNAGSAFLTIELKAPKTSLTDPKSLADTSIKASRWEATCFAIWNMQAAEFTELRFPVLPRLMIEFIRSLMNTLIGSVDDWLDPNNSKSLKADAVNIFETAWDKFAVKSDQTVEIEASIFVDRLSARLEQLRSFLVPALSAKAAQVVLFEGG